MGSCFVYSVQNAKIVSPCTRMMWVPHRTQHWHLQSSYRVFKALPHGYPTQDNSCPFLTALFYFNVWKQRDFGQWFLSLNNLNISNLISHLYQWFHVHDGIVMCAVTYFKVHHNFHSLHDDYMDSKHPTGVNPIHNHAHFNQFLFVSHVV